jgi:hypothetical protein
VSGRVRFTLSDSVYALTDGEPGPGEVARSQAEAWAAAGVPMEFLDDDAPPMVVKRPRGRPRKNP